MIRSILHRVKVTFPRLERLVNAYRREQETKRFASSSDYWQSRYAAGETSGPGSYGELARTKAEFLNGFVKERTVNSVVEFGCGDGNQLGLAEYPAYTGLDVSQAAVERCRNRFLSDPTKAFRLYVPGKFESEQADLQADLSLSLDVVYHLVEDAVFEAHLRHVFQAGKRFVIVYSSNTTEQFSDQAVHVRHRKFTDFVERQLTDWTLTQVIPNPLGFDGDFKTGSLADFYVYEPKH